MQRDLEIDLLRSFVAVAAHRNFTKAGTVVGRTQSAVSLQIKRLEEIIGKCLFDRSRNSVAITQSGETLLVFANRILNANDAALSHINRPSAEGLIRIGAPDDYATILLPPILALFSKENPLVQFEVTCDNASDLLSLLDNGELDLVIATHPQDAVAGTIARREPLHWVASADYIDDPDEKLSLVLFPNGCVCRDIALNTLNNTDRNWRVSYSTRSLALMEQALLAGSCVSVMEASIISPSLRIIDGMPGFSSLPEVVISVHLNQSANDEHISSAGKFISVELGKR